MQPVASTTETALFADDAKCIKKITCQEDCQAFQADLLRLNDWSIVWSLKFNVDKCKVLTVSRSRNPIHFNYSVGGIVLEHVGSFKDLGIVFDSNLSFREHTRSLICKANAVSGMIKRTVGYHAPRNVTAQLYTALTRSQLEYCTPVWSPYLNCDIKKIESVQRSMTRYILGYPDSLNYRERCIDLNILPMSFRREISDLVFLHKCIHGVYDVDINENLEFVTVQSRLRSGNQGTLLRNQRVATDTFKYSYFNRVVRMWNALPRNLRDCLDFKTFKSGLNRFYCEKRNMYDPDISCTWSSSCRCQLCTCTIPSQ